MSTDEAVREMLVRLREENRSRESAVPHITFAGDYPHPTRVLSEVDAGLWSALQEIATPNAKAEVLAVLARLPDGCSVGDILEELDEREHLRQGVASAIYEPLISQEEVEAWIESWACEASDTQPIELGDPHTEDAADWLPEQIEPEISASYGVTLTREEVLRAMDDLPDGCTVEDILHRLYVREQVKQGMWSLDNEPTSRTKRSSRPLPAG
jgi:hypothetical protein